MSLSETRVIGIDASLSATGWVILDNGKLLEKGTFKPKTRGIQRLADISAFLANSCLLKQVGIIAIEALSFNSTWGTIPLSEMHGAISLTLHLAGLPNPYRVAPATLKKFVTGSGRGEKSAIQMHVLKNWNVALGDNNQADAFGLAQIAWHLSPLAPKPKHKYQDECISVILKATALREGVELCRK